MPLDRMFMTAISFEHTDWMDESMPWRETCYKHKSEVAYEEHRTGLKG
jgi:hypothetical protein